MKNNSKLFFIFGLLIISIFVLAFIFMPKTPTNTNLEPFAQCLTDKGLKFYGAFWCPHCQSQKTMFGTAKNKLPYIECSTPDGSGQVQICNDAKVESYPTWEFPDGTRSTGEVSLETLAEKSGCSISEISQ